MIYINYANRTSETNPYCYEDTGTSYSRMESTSVLTMTVADESTAVPAPATADASTSCSTSQINESDDDPKSVTAIVAAINKHSDGTNLVRDTIATMSMMDGSIKKGDVMIPATEPEMALELLKELVEDAKTKPRNKPNKKNIWEFRTSPHEQFEKTLFDTCMAFLNGPGQIMEKIKMALAKTRRRKSLPIVKLTFPRHFVA
jgi:hypothetical protein